VGAVRVVWGCHRPPPIPFIVSKFKTPSKGFKLQAGAYAVSA